MLPTPRSVRQSRFSEAALRFFESRAIDPAVAAECGVHCDGDTVFYPVSSPDGSPFERRRRLDTGRTLQPAGVQLRAWWPRGWPRRATEVLVVEGESDALAAETALAHASWCRVLRIVSLPGTAAVAQVVAELRRVGTKQAWVALDADEAGRLATNKLIVALGASGVACNEIALPSGRDLAECLSREQRPAAWLEQAITDAQPRTPRPASVSALAESSLVSLAGSLRRVGLGPDALRAALTTQNSTAEVTVSDSTVQRIIALAQKWSPPPPWLTDPIGYVDDPALGSKERLVLLTLCLRARVNGTRTIGMRRLAELSALNKSTVNTAIRRLTNQGWIEPLPRTARRAPTTYRLLERPADSERRVRPRQTEEPQQIKDPSGGSSPYCKVNAGGQAGREPRTCERCSRALDEPASADPSAHGPCVQCHEETIVARITTVFQATEERGA